MFNVLALFFLVVALAYGWKIQKLRFHVVKIVRRHCQQQGIFLLDETVALQKKHWSIRQWWHSKTQRIWRFEFTVTGGERYSGTATTLGHGLASIDLPPHRFPSEDPTHEKRQVH